MPPRRRCEEQLTKKYQNRDSPAYPANACAGEEMAGNDGQLYESVENAAGIHQWRLKDRKSHSSKSRTQSKSQNRRGRGKGKAQSKSNQNNNKRRSAAAIKGVQGGDIEVEEEEEDLLVKVAEPVKQVNTPSLTTISFVALTSEESWENVTEYLTHLPPLEYKHLEAMALWWGKVIRDSPGHIPMLFHFDNMKKSVTGGNDEDAPSSAVTATVIPSESLKQRLDKYQKKIVNTVKTSQDTLTSLHKNVSSAIETSKSQIKELHATLSDAVNVAKTSYESSKSELEQAMKASNSSSGNSKPASKAV